MFTEPEWLSAPIIIGHSSPDWSLLPGALETRGATVHVVMVDLSETGTSKMKHPVIRVLIMIVDSDEIPRLYMGYSSPDWSLLPGTFERIV